MLSHLLDLKFHNADANSWKFLEINNRLRNNHQKLQGITIGTLPLKDGYIFFGKGQRKGIKNMSKPFCK